MSVVEPAYAWLNVWKPWLLILASPTRSSSSSTSSIPATSSALSSPKLACSRGANFSFVMAAATCRHQDVWNCGTCARAQALRRHGDSTSSFHTRPSSFAQRYGDSTAPASCCRRKTCRSGST